MTARNLVVPLAALMLIGGVFALSRERGRTRKNLEAAAPYDLSRYRITDPRLVAFDEEPAISIGTTPSAVAVDGEGTIYIAGEERILILDPRGHMKSDIPLSSPVSALAAGPEGTLYAAAGDRIVTVAAGGGIDEWTSLGEKAIITSLAAGLDSLYAADAGSGMIWRFDGEGRLKGTFGRRNLAAGEIGFIVPSPYFDLALGPGGVLWVANPGRLRVERHGLDGSLIDYWGTSSLAAEGFGGCCNPSHIALLPDGSMVTSEKGLPRVKVYGEDGVFRSMVAGPESFRPGTVGLDLAVDASGRILVLDPAREELRIFAPRGKEEGERHGGC